MLRGEKVQNVFRLGRGSNLALGYQNSRCAKHRTAGILLLQHGASRLYRGERQGLEIAFTKSTNTWPSRQFACRMLVAADQVLQ
ncbi:hypothetical protein [Elioraea rosea]|uniref:hypothetical protein n=1 Tax=Elioraea rosea TaxID=2492390 RepID=UPI0011831E1D|nr:hypothetical protein [Elioraea rosea]